MNAGAVSTSLWREWPEVHTLDDAVRSRTGNMKCKRLTVQIARRAFISLGLACLFTAHLLPRDLQAEEFLTRVYTNASGQTMPYRLLTPRSTEPKQAYPLVVFFHGAGERGSDNRSQLVHGTKRFLQDDSREQHPCLVVAPQCPEKQQWVDMPWGTDSGVRPAEPSTAMSLALGIVDALLTAFPIDTNRIYVTGLSMGGYATWDCVTRFPRRFAAGIPVCGGGDETTVNSTVARVPIWAFHSADDTVVKVARTRRMVEAFRAAGGNPKYFEYSGLGHNSWDKAYAEPELLDWLFAQRLGKTDTYHLKTEAPLPTTR
jgi:predicted peptidase